MKAGLTTQRNPLWSFITALIVGALIASATPITACIDPASHYAFEVVLNKPGVSYNITVLRNLVLSGSVIEVNEFTYVFTYLFQVPLASKEESTHNMSDPSTYYVELKFLVVVYIEKFSEGAPYVEELSDPSNIEYYLGVRIESLSLPANIREEDFSVIVEALIRYLVQIGVVTGLEWKDVEKVAGTARLGYAGWNNRLVYCDKLEGWAPYSELVTAGLIKGILYRGNACSFQLPREMIEQAGRMDALLRLGIATTTSSGLTSTLTSTAPRPDALASNGLAVALAVLVGALAGLLVYLYLARRD